MHTEKTKEAPIAPAELHGQTPPQTETQVGEMEPGEYSSEQKSISTTSFYNNSEIQEEADDDIIGISSYYNNNNLVSGRPPVPIATINREDNMIIQSNLEDNDDCVYVAVGKSDSSMDALRWTLRNGVDHSTTTVYLIHVFPEIRHVPSPLGNLPVSQVNRDQLESFMTQESNKRRQLLQKYLQPCHSCKVKVDTILIESDTVAKAITDLIPVLNVRKLVVGTSKSGLRKLRGRKGSVIAEQILNNVGVEVSYNCELKIICDGDEVVLEQLMNEPLPSPSPLNHPVPEETKPESNGSVSCMCFRGKFI